jgi:hypothetical protein
VIGESTNTSLNGDAPVEYAFDNDLTLGNEGDEIVLLEGTTVIHSVGYGNFDATPHSIQGIIPAPPIQSRAYGMSSDYCNGPAPLWIPQSSPFGTNNDLGTPGEDNNGVSLCSPDTTAPQILDAQFAKRDRIVLRFDEPVDATTALDTNHYRVEPGTVSPFGVQMESSDTVLLGFDAEFESDTIYTLHLQDIEDTASNPVAATESVTLSYSIPRISITEVMYNNRGTDLEWIELNNTTDASIDVSGWYLTDDDVYPASGEGRVTLPEGTFIGPNEYVVINLWGDTGFGLWGMPSAIRIVETLPGSVGSLANGGDNLALFDSSSGGTLVDGSLSGAYPDLTLDGESLEKMDELFPWGNDLAVSYNFAPCSSPIGFQTGLNENAEFLSSFATPGRKNASAAPPFPTATPTTVPTAAETSSPTPISTSTPTATATGTASPTVAVTNTPIATPTQTPTKNYDFAPTPSGDGDIRSDDLLLFLDRVRNGSEEAFYLFDFSRFWPTD